MKNLSNIWATCILSFVSVLQLPAQDSLENIAVRYPDFEQISFRMLPTDTLAQYGNIAESHDGQQIVIVSELNKKQSRVTSFDAKEGKTLWSHDGEFSSLIKFTDAGILFYNYANQQMLNPVTGEDCWRKGPSFWKGFKVPFYTKGNVLAVCNDGLSTSFYGIDLKTCKRIWKTDIDHNYGVADVYDIDDTHSFIAADHLYKIDWTTGKTTHTKLNIGDVSAKRFWASVGLGLAGAMPVGARAWQGNTLMPVMASWDVVSGRVSNFLESNGLYYLADQDYIRCFDKDLQERWKTPLPEDIVTRSKIKLYGDTLVMVNLSKVLKGGLTPDDDGKPFIAAFNSNDGSQLFYRELSDDEHKMELWRFFEDRVVMIYEDSCQVFRFADLSLQSYPWDKKENGKGIITCGDFYQLDCESHQFSQLSGKENIIINNKFEPILLPADGTQPTRVTTAGLLYYKAAEIPDNRLVLLGGAKIDDCWIINADGSPYCHFEGTVRNIEDLTQHVLIFFSDGRTAIIDK